MIWLVLIVLGAIFGSFVNALVWRLSLQSNSSTQKRVKSRSSKDTSIVRGRSMCSSCGHQLSAKDLMPVISWVLLKGRCRYCREKIADTPLPELLLPVLFVVSYAFWPYELDNPLLIAVFVVWLAVLVTMTALLTYDLRWMLLPDRLVAVLTGLAITQVLLLALDQDLSIILPALFAGVALSGLFYVMHQLSDGKWIGGGDVKIGFSLGVLSLGPMQMVGLLFLASAFGLVFSLPQLIRSKLKMTSKIPFGPFLIIATITSVIFGDAMINWYINLFLW